MSEYELARALLTGSPYLLPAFLALLNVNSEFGTPDSIDWPPALLPTIKKVFHMFINPNIKSSISFPLARWSL